MKKISRQNLQTTLSLNIFSANKMNPSNSAEKIEAFFRDVQSGSRALSQLANTPLTGIRPGEMQNYLAELSGQRVEKGSILKLGQTAYDLWLQRSNVRALDLVTEASISFQNENDWQEQNFALLVLTDRDSGEREDFVLPARITVGYVEDFAQSRGFFLFFIQDDNQIPPATEAKDLSEFENVQVALVPVENPSVISSRNPSVISTLEDVERSSPVSRETSKIWNYFLRPLVWRGALRLVRSEKVAGQEINFFTFDDLRALGGYLLRTKRANGRDFYAFDYDDTLASFVGDLRAQGYLAPAVTQITFELQGGREILHPGAEKLFEVADGNFVIITNRGKTEDPTKGTEGAQRFLEENGGFPAAVYGARVSPDKLLPKGEVFVRILRLNPTIVNYVDTFHFVDDDPANLESVREKLVEYFAAQGVKKTINLYHGAGPKIFALLQDLKQNEIDRYASENWKMMENSQKQIYTGFESPPRAQAAPVVATSTRSRSPPRAQAAPVVATPTRSRSPPRAQAAPVVATPTRSRSPPRRDISNFIHMPKVTISKTYPRPQCEETARFGKIRKEVCTCDDLRAVRDLVLSKGEESVFVFDFDDTLFARAGNVWYKGYAPPPSREVFSVNSEKFFPYPGTEDILDLASRRQRGTPRIMILTQRNERGVDEIRELMEVLNYNVLVVSVSRRGESVGKGERLVEVFSENPEWLRGVTDIYFVEDTEKHIINMLDLLPPFLNRGVNSLTVHTYQMPGVEYFRLDAKTVEQNQRNLGIMLGDYY